MPNFDILVLWINSNDVVAGIVLMAFSVSVIVLLQDWFGTLGVFYLGCFFGWIFLGFSELREDALNGIWNEFGTHCPKSFNDLLFDEEYCIIQDPHCSLLSTLYLTGGGYIDMMDFLKKYPNLMYSYRISITWAKDSMGMVKTFKWFYLFA